MFKVVFALGSEINFREVSIHSDSIQTFMEPWQRRWFLTPTLTLDIYRYTEVLVSSSEVGHLFGNLEPVAVFAQAVKLRFDNLKKPSGTTRTSGSGFCRRGWLGSWFRGPPTLWRRSCGGLKSHDKSRESQPRPPENS